MRGALIRANDDPDYVRLNRNGIKWLVFEHRPDNRSKYTRAYLDEQVKKGYTVVLFFAWNWYVSEDAFYEDVHEQVKNLRRTNSNPKVQLDHEGHDPGSILNMLENFRKYFPYQDCQWTFEGMQGGWMEPEFVSELLIRRVRLVPQLYNGDMTEVWDSHEVSRDLTSRSIPDNIISPFHDASATPRFWQGFAYTQAELP